MIISTNGTHPFSNIESSGWKAITLAGTWTGSVDIQQDGISFDGLDAVIVPSRNVIAVSHGSPVELVVTGLTGTIEAKLSGIEKG